MSEKTTIENPKEKVLVDLVNGTREPQNDYERSLQKDINKIKDEGKVVEIPTDI